ncbi:MAG: amino acid ABC transporter permease [Actinobacteria bacterium]|nr:amino acid ABC transporter permease [Actinomycetota bacterium]
MFGGKRGVVIATISTIAFFAIIAVILATAPGARLVQRGFFSPEHLVRAFPSVARGFLINVQMFLLAEVLVLVFALILAVLRSLPGPAFFPIRLVTIAYIDFFRGMPLLLVLFIVAFGLPGLSLAGISGLSQFQYGVISLTLVYSAYVAEVYRAGIESIHESQTAAARSLGLSRGQALRHVVLPQAIRRVIPPLLNDFIGLQKDTALVAAIGLVEGVRRAQAYSTKYFNFAGFVVAAILFVALTIPLARLTDYMIARDQRKRRAGGAF